MSRRVRPVAEASRRVWIGARGWRHPGWEGVYYPPDLPEDWRLDFYLNDFRALWLRPEDLRQAGEEEWATLAGLAPDSVRLVLECTPGSEAAGDEWLQRCRTAGVPLFGWVRADDQGWLWWPAGAGGESSAGVWDGHDNEVPKQGATGMALVSGRSDLRERRRQLQVLLASGAADVVMLVDGEPPSMAHLQELKLLADLIDSAGD